MDEVRERVPEGRKATTTPRGGRGQVRTTTLRVGEPQVGFRRVPHREWAIGACVDVGIPVPRDVEDSKAGAGDLLAETRQRPNTPSQAKAQRLPTTEFGSPFSSFTAVAPGIH